MRSLRLMAAIAALTIGLGPMLMGAGCVVRESEVRSAIAGPVTGAMSDVLAYALEGLLTRAGLLPGT